MIHVSEMDYEMEFFKPNSPITYLNDLNLLSDKLLSVHTIFTDKKDLNLLAENNVNVVYCPIANMKSAKGIANVSEMLDLNINVSLGSDGPISGNTLDLMQVLKVATISQRTKYQDRTLL